MLIDSHCHLDFKDFDADRAQVLQAARDAGVEAVVIPAVSQARWQQTIAVSREFHQPFALGLHPVFIAEHQPHHLNELDALITRAKPRAVGEIGLDFYLPELDKNKQLVYFDKQLIIANRHELPVIIHCRKAHDQCISALQEHQPKGGIIHAFNGSIQQAEKYIELGFLLGFGGMLTYARSSKLRRLAAQVPLENIALETDAPDMVVEQHRGERNSPEYTHLVAAALAEIKEMTKEEVALTTSMNVRKKLAFANGAQHRAG